MFSWASEIRSTACVAGSPNVNSLSTSCYFFVIFCNRELCGEKQNYGCDEASIRSQSSCSDFNTTVLKSRLNSGQYAGLNLGSNIRINISLYRLSLKKSCYVFLWLCSCYDKAIKVTFRSGYGLFRSDIFVRVVPVLAIKQPCPTVRMV